MEDCPESSANLRDTSALSAFKVFFCH